MGLRDPQSPAKKNLAKKILSGFGDPLTPILWNWEESSQLFFLEGFFRSPGYNYSSQKVGKLFSIILSRYKSVQYGTQNFIILEIIEKIKLRIEIK